MRAHVQKLLLCRVRPYYVYQCDLIRGSAHLRTSVRQGLGIMESLRGHTTGYAVPQYVIDAPGGGGKVPVNPDYVLSHNKDRVVIRNFEGKVFEYPEAPDGTPLVEASGVARRPVGGGGTRGRVIAGPRPAPPQLLEPPSVFISYASEDEAHARKLVDVLQASGLDPWFDKQGLRGGDRWDDAIRNALNEVDYVVVVQSAALAAKVRSYVNREIDLALQNQQLVRRGFCYLIPVRVDDSPELDELKHLQTVDVRDDAGCQDLVNVILRDQQRLRKKVA